MRILHDIKIGSSFEDFLLYLEGNSFNNYVEVNTVIGRIGGKVCITFQFVNVNFMFSLLLDNKTAPKLQAKYEN